MDLAIFTCKPSLARQVAAVAPSLFPDAIVRYPIVWPVGLYIPETIPALSQEYPCLVPFEEPLGLGSTWRDSLVGVPSGGRLSFWRNPLSFQEALLAPTLISLLEDTDMYHLDRALREVAGRALRHQECRILTSLLPSDIKEALTQSPEKEVLWGVNAGRIKQYFNTQFAVNSNAVLSPLPAVAGRWVSKYQIQLLYAFRAQAPATEGEWLMRMQRWPLAPLGSLRSFSAILSQLHRHGWIACHPEKNSKPLTITSLGLSFLDQLHPDCEDVDLPARLAQWCSQEFECVRPAMDDYLLEWFSRQKAFCCGLTSLKVA